MYCKYSLGCQSAPGWELLISYYLDTVFEMIVEQILTVSYFLNYAHLEEGYV